MSDVSDVIVERETLVLVEQADQQVLVEPQPRIELITEARQGPPGPPGASGGTQTVTVGASPLSGHTAVAVDASGLLIYADSSNPAHRLAVLGVIGQAYSAGTEAQVQTGFVLEHSGWTWTAGPVFVGLGGALVQTVPGSAVFCQVVGLALSATRILIDVQPPITIA